MSKSTKAKMREVIKANKHQKGKEVGNRTYQPDEFDKWIPLFTVTKDGRITYRKEVK